MLYNVMTNEQRNPLIYSWSQSKFTVYELQETCIPNHALPIEATVCPDLRDCRIIYNQRYWSLGSTCFDLNRVRDWHFGTVYAVIRSSVKSDQVFCSDQVRFKLINVSHYMKNYDCSSVIDGFCIYREEHVGVREQLDLIGLLIVASNHRDIAHNILLTFTTELDRELSLHSAIRYENLNIAQCLIDIEQMCIKQVEIKVPAIEPMTNWITTHEQEFPAQVNQPYLFRITLSESCTACGFIDYYTINCIGCGRLTVNQNAYNQVAIHRPNVSIHNENISAAVPIIVTQWLFTHKYPLIETFNYETKVRYNCYY